MTYKQQLTEELCTLDAIEKQIKELKMGCKLLIGKKVYKILEIMKDGEIQLNNHAFSYKFDDLGVEKIIGNPLEYHQLMMYCEEKDIYFSLYQNGYITFSHQDSEIIELDKTKPLSEQSEEVFEKILIALRA